MSVLTLGRKVMDKLKDKPEKYRFPGVRAANLWNEASAEMSRRHNDANVACFGARLQTVEQMLPILDQWLTTPFDGGRHERRVGKIEAAAG